ncbi:MAG: hypothetical protein WBN22_05135, partial [Verrucomicrobiia bacterium]
PNSIITGVAAFGLLTLTAMTVRADDMSTSTNAITRPPLSPYQPFTVGAEVGTTGFGGAANWRFSNHFGVGGGFDYFSYSYSGNIQGNNFDAKLRLQSEPLTLDLYPWKRSSFHVSVGGLFNQNHLTGTATGNNINLNGTTYSGTLNLDIKQQAVDPYAAIGGNLYFDRGHHVSLGGELGVIYTGNPRVNLTANTTPAANPSDVQAQQDKIQHYAKDAQFWPVLKVSLNFSF